MKVKLMLIVGCLIFLALLLAACNTANPDGGPPTATVAPPTLTVVATTVVATDPATAVPVITAITAPMGTAMIPAPMGTAIPDEIAVKEVAAALAATLPITSTSTATNTTGIEGVKVFKLITAANSPMLWLAYTYGLRNFDPEQNHVIAIYTQGAKGWQLITRQELKDKGTADNATVPDYLGEGSVTQVNVEPNHIWIQVEGGVGAHSGIYGLFSFDGKQLKAEANGFSSSPGAASLKDLNGDGIQEVLLDATDYYVFCYACGVRQVQSNLLRWDGTQLIPVNLIALPDAAPADLRTLNEHLITLAQAGLWKDALAELDQAKPQTTDPTFTWNAAYLQLNAEAKRDVTTNKDDPYPLLSQIFYGDYAAAVAVMRKHAVADLFRADSPLIVGTAAEGNEDALFDAITNNTNPALQVQPDLAPAYFLRGWAAYHKDPNAPNALADIKHAAALAADDTLYNQSAQYLDQQAGNSNDPQATEVAAALMASLGITNTGATTNAIGLQGAYAFKLDTGEGGQPLWLAYTYGLRNFDPAQNHVIAVYTPGANGWQVVARQDLKAKSGTDTESSAPDYLGLGALTQVKLEPEHIWLALEGGAGAHSGVFDLFSFDGATLKEEASSFNSRPGGGSLKDLNGDGIQEVVLDASDYYVFCYACGVRQVQYNILRWDGAKLIPVTLTALPESAPPALRDLNQTAMTLAQAGLWKEALTTIQAAKPAQATDETFTWNAAYIRLNAEAKRAMIGNANDPYPLLSNVFYSDFVAAVDVMRKNKPEQIFSTASPLITGTVAAGFEDALANTLTNTVEAALKVQPNLASAYFLRGWALYLKTKDKAVALPDVKHAAQLAPDDLFFTESVAYLEK